ncbi:hypothetical protein DFH08DRAFT_857956 [Mycena albidolilacea]|uniref:Uncharacterized protein n=1 Tax=Mycena albidolilacea TaxID=1033008 RepID=A0AAD7A8E4_9AGAR|nr:hypothetical protein DFH08DRAFT_857956 [Mycena albidolilacea]
MDTQTLDIPIPKNETEDVMNEGSLRPITSHSTKRYENRTLVETFAMEISPGLFTTSQEPEPEYLAPLWSAHVHPEGQLYFFREGPLRVVTEAYLYHVETFETVCGWIARIEHLLADMKILISEDIELFVEFKGQDCAYYFVDHATSAQFWLEKSDTEKLDLPYVASTSQLKIVIEELYWVHVEHFPMHLHALPIQKLEEIIMIFSHGLCDQMTSRVSTFNYSASDCKVFLDLLRGCRDSMNNGHTTWIIARLWSIIDHNKCLTFYGQEHSRLSRNQYVLWDPEQKHRWVSMIMAYSTFNTSERHRARLDDVFVDHMVYVDRWAQLVSDCLKQWKASKSGAFAGLALHIPFLVLNSPWPPLLIVSSALLSSTLGSSILLDHAYEPMESLSATDAMNYLESIQSSIFNFQCTAFAFSLPKALLLWGYLILLVNYLLLVTNYRGSGMAAGVAGLALLVVLVLYGTTSTTFRASWSNGMSLFCRGSNVSSIQIV